MKAVTVIPGSPGSAQLSTLAEPPGTGSLRVRMQAVGVCGTDREILSGAYGAAPPGHERLVIGHESLGEVLEAPADSGFASGDLVVGIVRRPDPEPCPACAVGEWDMCRNGNYTERGIKGLDGYAAQEVRLEPDFAVKVAPRLGIAGVLLEPASVVAKAWEHVVRIGARTQSWQARRAVITGAGPVGLLAALMAVQRGLETHVFDRVTRGPKPKLVQALGAHYHAEPTAQIAAVRPDVVIECTGAGPVVLDAIEHSAAGGITCLAGISSGGHDIPLDVAVINRSIVLQNDVVFGSVNANRRHYQAGADALAAADPRWLWALITRRVPLARWQEAYAPHEDDVKVVLECA